MTMTLERTSVDKSHLLAYLHHTPGFEHRIREFIELPINEILSRVRETDESTYRTCTARFQQQGAELEPNTEALTASRSSKPWLTRSAGSTLGQPPPRHRLRGPSCQPHHRKLRYLAVYVDTDEDTRSIWAEADNIAVPILPGEPIKENREFITPDEYDECVTKRELATGKTTYECAPPDAPEDWDVDDLGRDLPCRLCPTKTSAPETDMDRTIQRLAELPENALTGVPPKLYATQRTPEEHKERTRTRAATTGRQRKRDDPCRDCPNAAIAGQTGCAETIGNQENHDSRQRAPEPARFLPGPKPAPTSSPC